MISLAGRRTPPGPGGRGEQHGPLWIPTARLGVEPAIIDTAPSRIDLAQRPLSWSFRERDPPGLTTLRRLTAPAFRSKLIRHFTSVVDEVLA